MPVPQPEEVLELAQELTEARRRVAELESKWESFFSGPINQFPVTSSTVTMQFLKPRIIEFLDKSPERSYSMAAIARDLNAKENSVGPYLSELAKEGKIERRDRGMYGALRPNAEVSDDDIPF